MRGRGEECIGVSDPFAAWTAWQVQAWPGVAVAQQERTGMVAVAQQERQ